MVLYSISAAVNGILVATISQKVEFTKGNRRCLLISLAGLKINAVAAMWVYSDVQHNHLKTLIFKILHKFTGILSPYVAFSMLEPELFTWYGFAAMCTIVAIREGRHVLQFVLAWLYQRFVVAHTYVTETFLVYMLTRQLSSDVVV